MNQHTKQSSESPFRAIILYDGTCVLCNGFVRFVLRIDRTGKIGFAPLDSSIAHTAHAKLPEDIDSVVLLEGDRTYVRSKAVFRVFTISGGVWKVLNVLSLIPPSVSDAVYDWIATHRSKIFGRYDACPIPEERYRKRFLGSEETLEE